MANFPTSCKPARLPFRTRPTSCLLAIACLGLLLPAFSTKAAPTRNQIVIVIPEGAGFELLAATELAGMTQPVPAWGPSNGFEWSALTSFAASRIDRPTGAAQDTELVYDPHRAWSGTENAPPLAYPASPPFEGYQWLILSAPDGPSAATAFNSGFNTYLDAINWQNNPRGSGAPTPTGNTLIEWAAQAGLSAGILSDMPIGHATGAALAGLRSVSGRDRTHLIDQFLNSPALNLVVASGHPQYNALGQATGTPDFRWVSQQQWKELRSRARTYGWQVIYGDQNLLGIASSAASDASKRFIIMEYGDTTEIDLSGATHQLLLESLPASLRFQTRMALDFLNRDPDGFVAVIHMGRLPHLLGKGEIDAALKEMVSLDLLLVEIQSWMRDNADGASQHIICTPLYEFGLVWGSDSARYPYSQAVDRGRGRQPGIRVNHPGPTNTLVPLMIRGSVAQHIDPARTRQDPVYGRYLHASSLHSAIRRLFLPQSHVPPPAEATPPVTP